MSAEAGTGVTDMLSAPILEEVTHAHAGLDTKGMESPAQVMKNVCG